ncbi:MAG: DUF2141 domain-containing protein [Cytophagales bacterium]|nr:MAG: DUF2141 domain-containing protein [Cytophagales bacterium]
MLVPKEGLGFSNNAKMGTFRPPSFEKAKFEHTIKSSFIKTVIKY